MTKQAIIEETAAFYNSGNRGQTSIGYIYVNKYGNKCGVGRCMTDDGIAVFGGFGDDVIELEKKVKDSYSGLDDILKEEYRGHSVDFWADIQGFHDNSENWDKEGISFRGLASKAFLLEKYSS